MWHWIFVCALLQFASSQFPHSYDIPGVPPPPWQGPIADHQIGIPPKDTPEVAAAKAQLNHAYSQILAVLPPLAPEEQYVTPNHVVPIVHNPVHVPQHVIHQQQPYVHVHNAPTHITSFAEEVPRSAIGEVPEVHAARVAHLKAVQEAQNALPPLIDNHYQHVNPVVQPHVQTHPGLIFQNYLQTQQVQPHHTVQDTPEVAKAKADHAAAVAALLHRFK